MLSQDSAEAYIGWGRKLNGHLMASFVRNTLTKNYQNLINGFQVTVENVGDAFLEHSVLYAWLLKVLQMTAVNFVRIFVCYFVTCKFKSTCSKHSKR